MNRLKIYLILIAMAFVALAGCKDKGTDPQSNETSTLTYNGYTYKTVKIGNQWWLAENLRTTRYNDGTNIPYIGDLDQWDFLRTGGYCYYEYKSFNQENYGHLYNYYAIETGKLAPEGWRIPTIEDWNELIAFCGGEDVAGEKLKSKTGFCALSGGMIATYSFAKFMDIGEVGYWWLLYSTTSSSASYLRIYDEGLDIGDGLKNYGLSIRLIKE